MKKWRKAIALMMAMSMLLLAACGGKSTDNTSTTSNSTTTKEDTTGNTNTTEDTTGSKDTSESTDAADTTNSGTTESEGLTTPRNETLYLGGLQYGKPVNNNPLSSTGNFTPNQQSDYSFELVWETLYMFNINDTNAYPLLADGDWQWNSDQTVCTVKVKEAAHWNDNTPVTAYDVQATFDAHVTAQSTFGIDYGQYMTVAAIDDSTVEFRTVADNWNPLKVEEYLCKLFVMQKDYLDNILASSSDPKNEEFWDAPTSGPYTPVMYDSEQKWVCQRDDNYWGQDDSMWGKLPVPKYVAHNIYKDNDTTARAFRAGEVDVDQQYMSNLQDTWLKDGLPISTYYEDPPYQNSIGMPSAIFNTQRNGLDNATIRKAIAMAIDYDMIIESAMTGQSYTFDQVPRSIFNASDGEQALIKDQSVLDQYRWENADVEGAIALLDEAGIVDTDGDGIREYNGENLSFKCSCPTGWSDWEAAMTIVSDAGNKIGIQMETYFPDSATWNVNIQSGDFDISMNSYSPSGIANPWTRMYNTMYGFGGNFPDTMTFNYGRYYNPEVDEILAKIPTVTDEAELLDLYEQINIYYLSELPAVALMYRPVHFHEVNETVWTNYPADGMTDDYGVVIPPQLLTFGYSISGLYYLELVNP